MSQCEKILKTLESNPLTAAEAIDKLNIYRLSARVHDLRSRGHSITTQLCTGDNNGKAHHYAKYHYCKN